ncbi:MULTISPECIES: hypothetical protein [Pseudomonadati]
MKINEISHPLPAFIATVRVVMLNSSVTARTIFFADTFANARAMLAKTYGIENILSLSQQVSEDVIDETSKTLSPAELQVKSMSDRAKQLTQQAKQVKARNKLQSAQTNLLKASQPPRTH